MGAVPAACVKKGHRVDVTPSSEKRLDPAEVLTVLAVHNSTPRPGKITWDLLGREPYEIGAATMVLILNPDPIKEPPNGLRRR